MKKFRKNLSAGLTFLELMVVISIFGIIAGVVLFNYKDFSGGVNIQNTAQEIALKVVEAQRYAISGNIFSSGGASSFGNDERPTYGIYFDLDQASNGSQIPFDTGIDYNKQFVFYTDVPGGNLGFAGDDCNPQIATECIDLITINGSDYIEDICVNEKDPSSNSKCYSVGDLDMPVQVYFKRPFPDAGYLALSSGSGVLVNDMEIKIASAQGFHRTIVVWATGQISVED